MSGPIDDLERAVAALRAQRDRQVARIEEFADDVHEIAGIVRRERDLAQSRLDAVRLVVDGFLSEYGYSRLPMFKVGQDLANSIRKRLDGELDDL